MGTELAPKKTRGAAFAGSTICVFIMPLPCLSKPRSPPKKTPAKTPRAQSNKEAKKDCEWQVTNGYLEPKWLRYLRQTSAVRHLQPNFTNMPEKIQMPGTKKQKSWQHPKDFPSGPPPQYYPGPATVNFGVLKRSGVFVAVWPPAFAWAFSRHGPFEGNRADCPKQMAQ